MKTLASGLESHSRTESIAAAIGLATVLAAAGGALSLFSARIALGGGLLERVAVPGRMLLLVLLATAMLRWTGQSWREVGLRAPASWWRCAGLVVAGYVAVSAAFVLLTRIVFPPLGLVSHSAALFAGLEGDLPELLYWLVFIAWGSAAFGEELVFRGFVQTRLERLLGSGTGAAWAAVLAQGVIFAALHAYLGAGGAILAGATGLIIGALYLLGGRNLWPCIILHGLIDTITLTAVYSGAA